MAKLIKKQNVVATVGAYEKDGEKKKMYRTIGEIVTMQGDDGQYQFMTLFHIPHTKISIWDPKEKDEAKKEVPVVSVDAPKGDIPF